MIQILRGIYTVASHLTVSTGKHKQEKNKHYTSFILDTRDMNYNGHETTKHRGLVVRLHDDLQSQGFRFEFYRLPLISDVMAPASVFFVRPCVSKWVSACGIRVPDWVFDQNRESGNLYTAKMAAVLHAKFTHNGLAQ